MDYLLASFQEIQTLPSPLCWIWGPHIYFQSLLLNFQNPLSLRCFNTVL